jgi:two-component system nitrate/nitrite response regulator NarL
LAPSARHAQRTPPITVAIADPHELFRDALSRSVDAHPACTLTGSAESLEDLRATIAAAAPDVLVVDTELLRHGPGGGGETLRLPAGWDPPPPLLLVAEQIDAVELYAALESGVRGYLSKEHSGDVLCRAIIDVARGSTVLDPRAQAAMAGEVRLRTRDDRPLLSPREHQILRLIADGRTAPQIAQRLHLSTSTVKTHMLHLYGKLGVAERAAAVAAAMRWGLIE